MESGPTRSGVTRRELRTAAPPAQGRPVPSRRELRAGTASPAAPSVTSRRQLRAAPAADATYAASRSARPAGSRLPAWLPRAALVAALGGATIAVPLADLASPAPVNAAELTASGVYPSAYEVLSETVADSTPTTLLAPAVGVPRDLTAVSRSVARDPLPTCNADVELNYPNGQIPESALCELWDGENVLRGDAAISWTEVNDDFRAAFGRNLCMTDSYRTLAEQRRVAQTKPGIAATPGTSNHGWALAVDLCASEVSSSAVMSWLADTGGVYGWVNPSWAKRGGAGAYEPWHWEYLPGTTALGTDYEP